MPAPFRAPRLAPTLPLAASGASRLALILTLWLMVLPWLGGCASPRAMALDAVADQLAQQADDPEDDATLARDASAFYLKLSESVLHQRPDHAALAAATAAGFTRYAWAFVANAADRLEDTDSRAAARQRERAVRLYDRARGHAMAALVRRHPSVADPKVPLPAVATLSPEDVDLMYWAAAAWGSAIGLSTGQPARVADLPRAVALAERAYARAPDHDGGGLAGLMARLELARAGGDAQQAERYLQRAINASGGRAAGPWLTRAESIDLPAGRRADFETHLQRAIAIAEANPGLANAVMAERARWLLETLDDRF